MKRIMLAGAALLAAALFGGAANAQGTLKIGLIMPYSGQFADAATQMDDGVKLYVKEHGDKVAGKKIEFIRKDVGGIKPDVAKRLAQELVTRDKVDILAGFVLTPNAIAAGAISQQGKKFMVVMNAATSIVTTKSPYMVRTSMTIPQLNDTLGIWAAKHGVEKAYTIVTDYGPGHDAEQWFHNGIKSAGGSVIGSVRIPIANPDFSAFVQRAKDLNPQGIFVMIPGGAQPGAFGKALAGRGIDANKTKVMGQMEITDEHALKSMGDMALGIITSANYDYYLKSKRNTAFVKAYNAAYKRNPDFFSVGGYDGMHLIYAALKKTKGKTDAATLTAAAKGMSWESPRGPISIDPQTRDIVQTVYIRKVEKVGGKLVNVVIDKVANVKDPVHAAMMKK
jgi:branched-chain amino acid transport system substrate-binding protein